MSHILAAEVESWGRLGQRTKEFHEASLIGITLRAFAISLDPFGMLQPQVVIERAAEGLI